MKAALGQTRTREATSTLSRSEECPCENGEDDITDDQGDELGDALGLPYDDYGRDGERRKDPDRLCVAIIAEEEADRTVDGGQGSTRC